MKMLINHATQQLVGTSACTETLKRLATEHAHLLYGAPVEVWQTHGEQLHGYVHMHEVAGGVHAYTIGLDGGAA